MAERTISDSEAVKRLLILLLLKIGATSDEVGLALNQTGARIRQLIPVSKIKRIATSDKED